ncbi:MAG TPA: hypothetical protein VHJ17_22635 [Thermomonospora sp.]|nr:hypothetical protein [Thermomonospora sp.]
MSTSHDDTPHRATGLLHTAAGVADVLLGGAEGAARRARSLLRRSDLADLARDGHDDLRARGELAVRRYLPEPHLEVLARRAIARRQSGDA